MQYLVLHRTDTKYLMGGYHVPFVFACPWHENQWWVLLLSLTTAYLFNWRTCVPLSHCGVSVTHQTVSVAHNASHSLLVCLSVTVSSATSSFLSSHLPAVILLSDSWSLLTLSLCVWPFLLFVSTSVSLVCLLASIFLSPLVSSHSLTHSPSLSYSHPLSFPLLFTFPPSLPHSFPFFFTFSPSLPLTLSLILFSFVFHLPLSPYSPTGGTMSSGQPTGPKPDKPVCPLHTNHMDTQHCDHVQL